VTAIAVNTTSGRSAGLSVSPAEGDDAITGRLARMESISVTSGKSSSFVWGVLGKHLLLDDVVDRHRHALTPQLPQPACTNVSKQFCTERVLDNLDSLFHLDGRTSPNNCTNYVKRELSHLERLTFRIRNLNLVWLTNIPKRLWEVRCD